MEDTATCAPNPSFSGIERRCPTGADPVAMLLRRMHTEMVALAEGVLAVQTALSPFFADYSEMSHEGIRETQRLDAIEQTLRALADIATQASISTETGPLDIDEITKLCRLSDLAERLRGNTFASESSASAELELF